MTGAELLNINQSDNPTPASIGVLGAGTWGMALARRDIAVRGGLHCAPEAHRFLGTLLRGAVRASIGHANTFEEVERFLQAVRALL